MSRLKPKLFSIIKHREKELPRQQLTADIVSGIIVAIIALPLSVALAIASGVSPEKGLITAIIAGFIISFLGGSRVQIYEWNCYCLIFNSNKRFFGIKN